jgi:hypothetical protein
MKPINRMSDDEFARLAQRAAALPDAPKALVRAAIGQWQAAQPLWPQSVAKEILRQVTALLSFDSWVPAPHVLGVRAVPSDTRHLLFTAEGRDIDVRIAPAAGQFAVTGQILGPDESGVVELSAAPDGGAEAPRRHVATLDPLGEFRLDGIRRGIYVLTLRLSGDEIVLPWIDVGERPG